MSASHYARLSKDRHTTVSETNDPHLKDDVLAAYLDGALPAAERRVAEDHLAECVTCRDELVDSSKLVAGRAPVRRWSRVAASAVALAAAAIAFAVLGPWRVAPGPGTPTRDIMRESTLVGGTSGRPVAVVAPAEGEVVKRDTLRFTWHSMAPNATYLLKLSDETSVRWTIDIADTTVTLPDSVHLDPGRSYHWWVDALTADGRVASTGVKQFRTSQ